MENIFSANSTDFLDEINPIFNLNPDDKDGNDPQDAGNDKPKDGLDEDKDKGDDGNNEDNSVLDKIAKEVLGLNDGDDSDDDDNDGDGDDKEMKPATDRKSSNANKAIKKLIEKGVLLPFDDDKDISKYNSDDIAELIEANINELKEQVLNKAVEDMLETMPEELKLLNKYYLEGGRDIKNMFQVISKISDIKSLEVGKDDETIVRMYLKQNNWDDDEIDEEIEALKEAKKLTDRAVKYKEKLNAMQDEIVQKAIEEQNNLNKQRTEMVNKFVSEVKKSLSDGIINDTKINNKQIYELIDGLTNPKYDSVTGRKTNKLGYLLEKYQFVEPNIKLISEALWLLSNPDEYKNMLIEKGKQKAMEEIKKEIKTESQRSLRNSTMHNDRADENIQPQKRKLSRPNIFDRNF